MAKGVQIRRGRPQEAAQILVCLREAFAPYRSSYTTGAWQDTVLNAETLRARLDEMTVLVAVNGDEHVVGTIAYKIEHEGEAHLRGMAVHPGMHGLGVAQALLERVEAELRESGCKAISLDTTRPLQRAIRFYEQNGFYATGAVTPFFGMELIGYRKEIE